MNLLLTFFIVAAMDRLIPISAWIFCLTSFKTGLGEIFLRYKLFSFPRTVLAVCVCAPDFLAFFFALDKNILDAAVLALYFLFAISAIMDAAKAIRSGGYREGIRSTKVP